MEVPVSSEKHSLSGSIIFQVLANPYTQELTTVVRKELAPALRDLIHHGLMEVHLILSVL
jgi:hypothetical protein